MRVPGLCSGTNNGLPGSGLDEDFTEPKGMADQASKPGPRYARKAITKAEIGISSSSFNQARRVVISSQGFVWRSKAFGRNPVLKFLSQL